MSSFPNYKNKTLPSKSPKMKSNRILVGEGMFQGQGFLHSSNCYVILYKYGPTMKNHLGKSDFPFKSLLTFLLVAVYYWQGEMTSSDVRAACALQAFRIEHEASNHGRRLVWSSRCSFITLNCLSCRSTDGHLIRVEQGREPSHFVRSTGGD